MDKLYSTSYLYTVDQIIGLLNPFLAFLIRQYELIYSPVEKDYRSGFETYGYENEESILSNIDYISDRWGCAFRVRWIINLLDSDYKHKN